jgi:Divergent InlB B-repeat domain
MRVGRVVGGLCGATLLLAGVANAGTDFRWHGLGAPVLASRTSVAAIPWCGLGETSVNRPDSVDVALSSPNLVHVSYVVPSDGVDRFASFAPAIVSDLAAADAWWQAQDATRTPRFDLADFPCSTRLGRLDLSFVRLPSPGSAYMGPDRGPRLTNDLVSLGPQAVKNLVYYDGPTPADSAACGFTNYLAPGAGGPNGFAFVLVRGACPPDLGQGGIMATDAVHELTHNLGAVLPGAPHACPGNTGHACDSNRDLMWPYATPDAQLGNKALDVGRDDYYAHAGSWFDVQDSPWLVHLPQFPLTVASSGNGNGTVRIAAAGGSLECSSSCSEQLDNGTPVRLTAEPASGNRLVAWQGSCSGTAPQCDLTADGAKSATAIFGTASYGVVVTVKGKGKVTSSPTGIACPRRCRATFTVPVTLRARPAKHFRFAGWSGACRGKRTCILSVDNAGAVRAVFRRRS